MKLTSFFEKYRWDSSDPDRAPPPLPLNPGSSSPASKPNTSATIAAAAEALTAKSRESAYTTNPMPSKSPEKSLIKGQYHKRMQSLQNTNGNVRDFSSYIDSTRSPERSPERPSRTSAYDYENRSPERSPTRSGTPTPSSRDLARELPSLRPASRPPPKAILGENTPTSATMLALQNTPTPKDMELPLSDITNNSTALTRTPQSFDAISSQILSLTGIATNLQREMAQLSRRSKDNATDLISLKEATNARDEDIRQSLRDLVSNLSSRLLDTSAEPTTRSTSHYSRPPGAYLLDNKPHASPPGMAKSFSLPRIPSPNSFAASLEREIVNSPSPYSLDGAASIALLEKILREMGTKEGQERLMSTVSQLKDQSLTVQSDPAITQKLEEILAFLKDNAGSRALVSRRDNGNGHGDQAPRLELDFENSRPMPLARSTRDITPHINAGHIGDSDNRKPYASPRAADFVSDDILKMLKRMKDSITEGGGLSAEIKALVRELRGEVLGMGREIGRKLEQAESSHGQSDTRGDAHGPGREEIAKIVEDGLAELKEHMDRVMRERRRQSSSSSVSRSTVDSQEVYIAVKNALSEMPLQQQVAVQHPGSGIEREEILEAVREAWETYKPEIELQNFGLERDEILQCLKEGLQDYQPQNKSPDLVGASYEEVLEAVREGLKHFKPPAPVETEATITRGEILTTVRECLEAFEFPTSVVGTTKEPEVTREDVLDAVKEGLSYQPAISKELEFNREDLFDAVKAGLEGVATPMAGVGEQVLDKIQDLIEGMRGEFKQYSAANGRDTEQVLDALKDGLEVLRADVETYVDRAADVTGKDEIIETVRDGLEHLRNDLEGTIANIPRPSESTNSGELLDAMEKEFEHLRQTIATSMVRSGGSTTDKEDILDAIRDGLEGVKDSVGREPESQFSASTITVMKEEFEYLRETLATTLVRGTATAEKQEIIESIREGFEGIRADVERGHDKPESILSNTSELLDALNDGLDSLRTDVEKMVNKPMDMTVNYEILDTLKEGLAGVRADIDRLHAVQGERESLSTRPGGEVVIANEEGLRRNDIENLEVLITQLRIKVEALDNMPPSPPQPHPTQEHPADGAMKEGIAGLEAMLKEVQASVASFAERERVHDDNTATKDDTDAIETLLINTKAKLDELIFPEPEGMARTEHLDSVEALVKGTRDVVEDFANRYETDGASKEDVVVLETLLKDIRANLDDIRENIDTGDKVTKTDIEALETLCMDTKTQIEELPLPDLESLPTKAELEGLTSLIKDFKDKMEAEADLTAQAFESRKIEHGGIADKIEDVKGFLDDVRQNLGVKLDGSGQSIETLAKTLETIHDAVTANDTIDTVKELFDVVNREFERAHGSSEGAKLEFEQNHAILLEKHDEHKAAILKDLSSKIDGRFDEIMIKYDDAQIAAEAKAAALNERDSQQTEALEGTRAVAEDLKILVDTLGSTVTESCDRMGEDSKTVYNRIEDIGSRFDQGTNLLATNGKADHQLTRAEISKTLVAVEAVQAHVTDYHPKILDAVKDVLNIVGQQYEQVQKSTEEIKSSVNAIPSAITVPAITAPLPPPLLQQELPSQEKYDDSEVHAKLDKLVEQATEAGKSVAHFQLLEEIKEQVVTTANGFNAFVAVQQAAIAEKEESCSREAEEAAIALERRVAQKENEEADIVRLSDEKVLLSTSIEVLRREKEELATQKSRLQADLSSLQTALEIRREEMQLMEARAEGLERRILEGVLDHSRSLLMTSRPHSSLKAMNLKRVISTASSATTMTRASTVGNTVPTTVSSAISSGVGMALKRRQPMRNTPVGMTGNTKGDRRILSLSTIGANKGPVTERGMVLASPSLTGAGASKGNAAFGSGGLKRSHSVKSNFPVRKTSWGGTRQLGMYGDDVEEEDKENSVLDEGDEEGSERGTERRTSYGSGTETERRTSYTGTYTGTGSYGTGSVVDGADERRMSFATSTVGTIGRTDGESLDEEEDDQEHEGIHEEERDNEPGNQDIAMYTGDMLAAKGEISNASEMVIFGPPSDSGIGTDLPTAAMESVSEYFKSA
ncbi:hypothetical protein MMC24_000599 [Lignoscripta atroalba]|nr:hypothetical protein [Lignoscripta atroalba]